MPQSQTADLPRHQEEDETDKTKQAQTEQTHEKHQDMPSLPQARQPQCQKDRKTQEQNNTRQNKTNRLQNNPESNKAQDQHRDHRLKICIIPSFHLLHSLKTVGLVAKSADWNMAQRNATSGMGLPLYLRAVYLNT